VTGYRIYYNGGTDQGSRDAMAGDTTVTIGNHTWDLTYSIKMVALSNHLPSPVIRAEIVNSGKYNASNNNEVHPTQDISPHFIINPLTTNDFIRLSAYGVTSSNDLGQPNTKCGTEFS